MFAIDTGGKTKAQRDGKGWGARRGVAGQQGAGQDERSMAQPAGRDARTVAASSSMRDATNAANWPSLATDPIGYGFSFMRRRFWSIALLGLLGLGVGAALGLMTPNRYFATAQMLIDPRDLRVLQNEIAPQSMGGDAATAFLESQVRVIASDSIKRQVIEKLGLASDPDFGGPRGGLLQRVGLGEAPQRDGRDPVLLALAAMDKQVIVRRGERTFVIDITAISGDGAKSARVANAMAEAYLDDQTTVRSESAQRASNSLTARLSELRERVRLAEDKVETYRAANNLVGAGGKLVTEEQLGVSSTQLSQARARTADAQAKFDQVRAVRPTSIEAGATPEALNSSSIATLRSQLGSALTREADALVLYGAQHPLLVSAQAQVRDARRQIAEELARIVQAARAELDRARASEAALNAQVERLKRETLTTGQAGVQLRELEREADANRQVYQAFLLRARETGEQTGVDTTNARIISSAVAPLEKAGPNRTIFALGGLIAGLGLGLMFGLGRDALAQRAAPARRRADDPDDEHEAAGAAPAARQPAAQAAAQPAAVSPAFHAAASSAAAHTPPPRPAQAASGSRWRGLGTARLAVVEPAVAPEPGQLVVMLPAPQKAAGWRAEPRPVISAFHGAGLPTDAWDDPASPLAAAIAQIRDRLVLEEVAGTNRKVAVLGLSPGAGASMVALNLALSAAREKATPILIDLASGPSSLSASFAADAEIGAEEVISGESGLVRAALQDDETGTYFLPRPARAQRRPAPAAQRLQSGLFEQTKRFEAVVIDAGSASDGALPHLLAELVDDLVVVAPGAMSAEQAGRLIRRALGEDAGKVRCIALNQAVRS